MPPNEKNIGITRNTSFKGDVLRLVSGTGIAQIIGLAAAPILTRLYAPEAFGAAALFASITGIFGVIVCMRYELSIVLPESDREAANLLAVCFFISMLVSFFTILIVVFASVPVLNLIHMPELAPFMWLIPIAVFMAGIFTALDYWNTRTKHFVRLSIARVTSQLSSTGGSLGLGFAGNTTGGSLISASLVGQAVATAVLAGQILRDNGRFILNSISWQEMWSGVKRHRNFPLYSSWAALINTASWQLPVLMLGAFFSPAVVGMYSLGFRLIQMPMSLIGGAISQVFLQRAAEAKSSNELGRLVGVIFNRLLLVGLLPTMIIMAIGADLFAFVFGEQWREAGVYVQILAPWALVWFVSSPLSSIYSIKGKQKNEFVIHSLIFVLRIVSIAIGGYYSFPRLAIALFSLGGIIAYSYLILQIFNYSNVALEGLVKKIAHHTLFCSIYMLPIIVVSFILYVKFYWIVGLATFLLCLFYYNQRNYLSGKQSVA
ncbi:MAG: oligosaccharide flippase family protein [Desulfuromonadaceae bacterium]